MSKLIACSLVAVLLASSIALAADQKTVIDLSPLLSAVLPVIASSAVAAVIAGVTWVFQHVKILRDQRDAAAIGQAVGRAVGEMFTALDNRINAGPINVSTGSSALAIGANYLNATVPDAMKRMGVTPDKAATMLRAEAGRLLAQRPDALPVLQQLAGADLPAPSAAAALPKPSA